MKLSALFLALASTWATAGTFTGNSAPPPDFTGHSPFVAVPPYSVLVNGVPTSVSLGGVQRTYNLGSGLPFVNSVTGVPDEATFNYAPAAKGATVLVGASIPTNGDPPWIARSGGDTILSTQVGDVPFGGRCRTQETSFAIPSRTRVFWDLVVSLGSASAPWALTTSGTSPTLIWELKPSDTVAPLTMVADTDLNNPSGLMLTFGYRGGNEPSTNVGRVHGLARHTPISIKMEVFLDERYPSAGGQGYWKVWINGTLAVSVNGPTLFAGSTQPHQSIIGPYMYNDPCPNSLSRTTYWTTYKFYQY